ncbi:MAG: helix-turn-helix transcriptional regulator [Lachnospiraceae bacterium]|nr:helix-turn-helix transcriptional regulator [Lachnospiraceae bacterium]
MIPAYSEQYLHDAMRNLGEAFDYAANACMMDMDDFMHLFLASGYGDGFGKGIPGVIVGMSGTELAMAVISRSGKKMAFPDAQTEYECSAEYWCGWILAFYQWETGLSFRDINDYISMKDIYKLYPTLHEAAEEKFTDTVNALLAKRTASTRLQSRRKIVGMTQAELSRRSGVNLRTLQQYESGAKSINKASVQNVSALAGALGCGIDDILEFSLMMS